MKTNQCWHPGCATHVGPARQTCRAHGSLPRPNCSEPGCSRRALRDSSRCQRHGGMSIVPPPKAELMESLRVRGRAGTAAHYHVSDAPLRAWLYAYGIHRPRCGRPVTKPCPISKAELRQLIRAQGLAAIGRRYGVNALTVRRWLIGYGLKSPRVRGQYAGVHYKRRRVEEEARQKLRQQRALELRRILAPDLHSDLAGYAVQWEAR